MNKLKRAIKSLEKFETSLEDVINELLAIEEEIPGEIMQWEYESDFFLRSN